MTAEIPHRERDRSDAVVVTYSPTGRAPRRHVFEPMNGDGPAWERIEEVQREDGTWRRVGGEPVSAVSVAGDGDG